MFHKIISRVLMLVLISTVLNACTSRVKPLLIDNNLPKDVVIEFTKENSPKFCAYKGKAVVTIKNFEEELSFNALIDKRCNGDMNMVILGALNMAVANFNFVNGEISASSKKDGDITTDVTNYISPNDIKVIIDFMDTNKYLPKDNDMMKRTLEYYIFKRDKLDILVNERFYVAGYTFPTLDVIYEWGIKEPQTLIISNRKATEFRIKFNEKNWIKYDKNN